MIANAMKIDMDGKYTTPSIVMNEPIDFSTLSPVPHVEKHPHDVPILETNLFPEEKLFWEAYNTTTYLTIDSANKMSLNLHITFIIASLVFIYPICLVLNNVESKWYLPILSIHLLTSGFAILNLIIFLSTSPDLYPDNSYIRMSWILLIGIICHYIISLIHYTNKWMVTTQDSDDTDFIPLNDIYYHDNEFTSPSSLSLLSQNRAEDSLDLSRFQQSESSVKDIEDLEGGIHTMNDKKHSSSKVNLIFTRLKKRFPQIFMISSTTSTILFNFLNYPIFFLYLVYFPTGIATVNLLGIGNKVFNLLAHFIKGGIFFSLGLLSLVRYCGGFREFGWSWTPTYVEKNKANIKWWFRYQPQGLVTMELIESSLILFYGSTNIFMEHLASPGGEWSAKDLQHVSIAFIYIGCGLCGVIMEFKLSNWRYQKALEYIPRSVVESEVVKASPGYSPNPFPALTIFWTGILMSSHHQASALSTAIHIQWGKLLSYGSFFRGFTIVLSILLPINQKIITKPFTELVTSFCLLSGGLIFMESTDPVVLALEYRGLTAMFTLNLCLGIVTLIMAWIMTLMSLRDHLRR